MTTTPDTERRERYAAVLNPMEHYTADDGYGAVAVRTPEELADAAMTVADQEQQETADGCVRFTAAVRAENDRLRKEAAEVRAAALTEYAEVVENLAENFRLRGDGDMEAGAREVVALLRENAEAAARPDNTTGGASCPPTRATSSTSPTRSRKPATRPGMTSCWTSGSTSATE